MIAVRLRFLAGRFHATPWGRHVNEGAVEWPPSSWRFLRALTATYYRAHQGAISHQQLTRILTELSTPPVFHLPPAATAHTRHYDAANGGIKFFDVFVAVDPATPLLMIWPDAELADDDRRALAAMLESLGTFGRAESWCEAELLEPEIYDSLNVQGKINSAPLTADKLPAKVEPVRLLLPDARGEELMKALTIETSIMRKGKQLDPSGARWVTYTRSADALTPRPYVTSQHKRKQVKPMIARFALDSTVLPLAQDALPFAEQARRALIRNRADTAHSEVITGKTADGTPLEGHTHAHYFATDEDCDGRLDHLTVYAPRGFEPEDIAALGSLRTVFRRGNRPDVRMVLTGLGAPEAFSACPLFAPSRRWRSVTPFSLPRFANRGGGKAPRPRDLPEAQLVRELASRGLPEPVSIRRVKGYQAGDRPLVRWLDFHSRRGNGAQGHGLAGFEIEFPESIIGPLALGFGCHFGLGLFLPCAAQE